ncbi:exodeoxyribonuclease VII large subunit [compost metagenome]
MVSPLATLGRGYSILLDGRGRAVRRAADTAPGQRLSARLHEGELKLRVEETSAVPATLDLPL